MLEEVGRHTLAAVMLKLQTGIQGIEKEDGILKLWKPFLLVEVFLKVTVSHFESVMHAHITRASLLILLQYI